VVSEKEQALQRTPLSAWHESHGGRMVPFAGFLMPVQYAAGVLAEHAAVRERVGLFDISHMGEIRVSGEGAEGWLDGLVTNTLTGIAPGKIVYTAMCREDGGVLDDMLIYRLAQAVWLVVCNAVNRVKIVAWLRDRRPPAGVTLADVSDATALIAVQGPQALPLIERSGTLARCRDAITGLSFYTGLTTSVNGAEWVVSRTGYTGERGYEIYLPGAAAPALWEELLTQGADLGAVPVGLAARDTLRFEIGYCLYGHELAEDISPLEAGIGWAVKFKKAPYVGLEALRHQKEQGVARKLVGVEVEGRAIARQGATILAGERAVGRVTSGNFSPTLKRSLALALLQQPLPASDLSVEVRGRRLPCRVVPYPFMTARVKGDPRAERELPA
jgi:aminomethyltransferase